MGFNFLRQWEIQHFRKIASELGQLNIEFKRENIDQILEQTSFRMRSVTFPEACSCYKRFPPAPCHQGVQDFNCLLCACPFYDCSTEEGGCNFNSRLGKWYNNEKLPKGRVWDCSSCPAFHTRESVKKYLEKNFDKILALINS